MPGGSEAGGRAIRRPSLVEFFGLRRGVVGLLAMAVLVGMGERMAERFLPIYLMALGGGPIVIGLLNGLDVLLSALYALVGGWLADRIGARRSLFLFNLLAALGFLLVILVPAWPAVIAGALLFLSWTAVSLPATMSLIAEALPEGKRVMGVTVHSLVRRVPMALGPILGGLCIGAWGERDGVRAAFVAALAMAAVAIVLQRRLLRGTDAPAARVPLSPRRTWRLMGRALKVLLLADVLVRFCEQIPYAFVVVWCMKTIASPVSAAEFGVLTAIEMATAVLVYVPVARWADRGAKKPFITATFAHFTLFPLVLLCSRSFPALAVAFVVRGLKEFGEPTRKALILELAPAEQKASAFGLYYLVRDSVVSIAAFGGAFLWRESPEACLLVASAFGAAGTLWFAAAGRDASGGALDGRGGTIV